MMHKVEKNLDLITAKKLLDIATEHPKVTFNVIDDGCHERAEAIIAIGVLNNIDINLLSRVFLINGSTESFIQADKPLAKDSCLQNWFKTQQDNGRLKTGSTFEVQEKTFFVDDYGALRAKDLPTIYLDSSPKAFWGVAHVAPMIGNFVIDPAVSKDPIFYRDWKEEIQTENVLPVRASINSLPDIDFDLLSPNEAKRVLSVIDPTITKYSNMREEDFILRCCSSYHTLLESEKSSVFYNLFKTQIDSNSLLPKDLWSELSITPLTTRGEKFGEVTDVVRKNLNIQLQNITWEERLELTLNAMSPFKNFEDLILGAEFSWHKP